MRERERENDIIKEYPVYAAIYPMQHNSFSIK